MTIPEEQVIYKESNEGKLSKQLRFLSGGNSGINELRIHAKNKLKSQLNKSNKAFLDYLTSDYTCEILAKNKIKIRLATGNIYRSELGREHLCFFTLVAKRNKRTFRL